MVTNLQVVQRCERSPQPAAKFAGQQPPMEPALQELLARVGLASQAPDFAARRFCSVKQLAQPPGLSEQDLGFLKPLQRRKFRAALADAAIQAAADDDADDDWAQAAAAATRRSRLTADDVPGFGGDIGSSNSSGSGDSGRAEALRRPSQGVDEVELLGVEWVEVQTGKRTNTTVDDDNDTHVDSNISSKSNNMGASSSSNRSSSLFASRKKSSRHSSGGSRSSNSSSSNSSSISSGSSSDSSHRHHHDGSSGSNSSDRSGYAIDKLASDALAFAFAPERAVPAATIGTFVPSSSFAFDWQSEVAVEEVEVVLDDLGEGGHSDSSTDARAEALLKRVLGTAGPSAADVGALMQLADANLKLPSKTSSSGSSASNTALCVAAAAYCAQEGHGSGCLPHAPRARSLWANVDFDALCSFAAGHKALFSNTTPAQDAGCSSRHSTVSVSSDNVSKTNAAVVAGPTGGSMDARLATGPPPLEARNLPGSFLARCAQFLVGVAWYTGAASLPEPGGGGSIGDGTSSSGQRESRGSVCGCGLDAPTGVWWLRAAAGGDPIDVASALASTKANAITTNSSSRNNAATASEKTTARAGTAGPAVSSSSAEFPCVPLAWSWLGEACAAGVACGSSSGGGQDWTQAQQWFALAACRGVPDAMNGLGVCFERFCATEKGLGHSSSGSGSSSIQSDTEAGLEDRASDLKAKAAQAAAAWYLRAYEEGGLQAQRDARANLVALQASHPEVVPRLPLNPDGDDVDNAAERGHSIDDDRGAAPPMTPPSKTAVASAASAASSFSSANQPSDAGAALESSLVCCSASVVGWRASMAHGDRHLKLRREGVKAGQVVRGVVRQAPHPLQSGQHSTRSGGGSSSSGSNGSSSDAFAWWLEAKVPGRTDGLVAYLPGAPASAPPGVWTNFMPSDVTTSTVEVEPPPSTPKTLGVHAESSTPPRISHHHGDSEISAASSGLRSGSSSSLRDSKSSNYPMRLKERASAAASMIASTASAAAAHLEQRAVASAVNRVLRSPPQQVSHDDLALLAAAAGAGPYSLVASSSSALLANSASSSSSGGFSSGANSHGDSSSGSTSNSAAVVVSQPRLSRRPACTRDPLARACWAYMLRFGHGVEVDLERASALWAAVDWAQLLQLAGGPEALAASSVNADTKASKNENSITKGAHDDPTDRSTTGDANAQYLIGSIYESGKAPLPSAATSGGAPTPDKAAAVQWYRLAAAQNHPRAQHALGVCYFYGDGVDEDKAASVRWDTLAAAQGHAKAQYSLGVCYDNGEGVEQEDEEKAAEYYALAAEQGFALAQYTLAQCYEYGSGVSEDLQLAAVWYRKASAQGHDEARQALAAIEANWKAEAEALIVGSKLRRVLGVPTNRVAATHVHALLEASPTVATTARTAAAAATDVAPARIVVDGAARAPDGVVTDEKVEKEATPDDVHCCLLAAAATCFLFGYGVAVDVAAAKALFALVDVPALKALASQAPSNGGYKTAVAAAANDSSSNSNRSSGVSSSSSSSNESTKAAVEAAVAGAEMQRYAQFLLGGMLLAGHGAAEEDDEEAVEWLERAAAPPKHEAYVGVSWHPRGLAHAQYSLGSCHYYGIGVEFEDDLLAAQLYTKAAEQGHGDAWYFLGILEEPQPDPTAHLPPPLPANEQLAFSDSETPLLAPSLAGMKLRFPVATAAVSGLSKASATVCMTTATMGTDPKKRAAEAHIDAMLVYHHQSETDADDTGDMEEEVKDSAGSSAGISSSKFKGQAWHSAACTTGPTSKPPTAKTAESPPRNSSSTTPRRRRSHDLNNSSGSNDHSSSSIAGAKGQGPESSESRGKHTPPRKPTKASPALRRAGSGPFVQTVAK